RPARVRAGSGAGGGRCGSGWRVHGDASEPRAGAVGRTQCMAARTHAWAPRDAQGDRRAGQATGLRREPTVRPTSNRKGHEGTRRDATESLEIDSAFALRGPSRTFASFAVRLENETGT